MVRCWYQGNRNISCKLMKLDGLCMLLIENTRNKGRR